MADRYIENMLGENEHIIFTTRRHWLLLISKILTEGFLIIALAVLVTLIWRTWSHPLLPLAYLLILLPLLSIFPDVFAWRNQQYIVTNWRVIQISGLFNKDVTDSSLEKVNDVKLEQSFWGRMLNYGDIQILTASEQGVNKFSKVEQPIRLKTAMLNAKEKLEQSHGGGGRQPQAHAEGDIVGLIAQLDNLRKSGVLTEAEFQQKKAQLLAKL